MAKGTTRCEFVLFLALACCKGRPAPFVGDGSPHALATAEPAFDAASPSPTASTHTTASTYAAGPRSVALCDDFRRAAKARDTKLPSVVDTGPGGFRPEIFDDTCYPTPNGAWAIALGDLHAPPARLQNGVLATTEVKGSMHPVHLDSQGARSQGPPHAFTADQTRSFRFDTTLFDYDGDGEPELLLSVESVDGSSLDGATADVLTSRAGVRPYSPAARYRATHVRDVDRDGRPDLIFTGEPVESVARDLSTAVREELQFVAHSLSDGTFSDRDAPATEYARAQCPQPPSRIVDTDAAGVVDEFASVKAVHCARLWNVTATEIKEQLARTCVPPTARDWVKLERSHVCFNLDLMKRWADFVPPLFLGGP